MKNRDNQSLEHKRIESWYLTLREFVFEMKELSGCRKWPCDLWLFNIKYIIYSGYAKIVKKQMLWFYPIRIRILENVNTWKCKNENTTGHAFMSKHTFLKTIVSHHHLIFSWAIPVCSPTSAFLEHFIPAGTNILWDAHHVVSAFAHTDHALCSAPTIQLGHTFPCTWAQLAPETSSPLPPPGKPCSLILLPYFPLLRLLPGQCSIYHTIYRCAFLCFTGANSGKPLSYLCSKGLRHLALTVWTWVTCLNNRSKSHPSNNGNKNNLCVID